ncbi:hypothetical protein I316_04055 [Kwoniella heveanensis BCC8398]|uniref:RING-type E3 ubiquitin transferase n=1 Tax=Kwoniella heveanensis BCC8398 TaxID=1296120 RepID=A0A1B9GSZ4_9TREE|nr:hypothetical protein I316_04055 [Kwoniella heveanensis BCC8398]
MPRKAAVNQSIYLDEAEGFILEHALFSPPRTWPPLPPEPQASRLASSRKKMDWEEEVRAHPDEEVGFPIPPARNMRKVSTGSAKAKANGNGAGHGHEGEDESEEDDEEEDANSERCVICLMALRDRTIVGVCGHEFCFECIGVWANQSRRCPLCSADMAPFLLHDLDASKPTKFYLPPLPSRKLPSASLPGPSRGRLPPVHRLIQEEPETIEPDELDLQVERRREIYRHGLYVKHIGSNPTTRFRPNPTPRQLAEDPILIQRATAFLRRELRVWSLVDVEFLTTYILSLLKTIDIRSEPAIRLLADFLDDNNDDENDHRNNAGTAGQAGTSTTTAEHFAHELYNFLRSPYKELRKWDEIAQYDPIPSSPYSRRSLSQASPQRARSRSRARSQSRSSISRSPSPYSSRSGSPSPSRFPSKRRDRGRDWHRRDTFVPSVSPDAKRWDEHDTWLDPEYAAWLEEEKRRDEERRDRKRARTRRASELDLPAAGRDRDRDAKAMRAWGVKVKVELLPDQEPEAVPLRMDEVREEPEESIDVEMEGYSGQGQSRPSGLTIRGTAKSADAVPTAPKARLTLLERLAKAKAEVAAGTSATTPSGTAKGGEAAEQATSVADGKQGGLSKRASILERLAKAKAEAASRSPIDVSASSHPVVPAEVSSPPPISPTATLEPTLQPPPLPHSISDPTSQSTTTLSAASRGGLRAMVRARLALKLKLENEKATLRHNIAESKAKELRRLLLERKALKEAEEVASNYGGMDHVLKKMSTDERKREVRRRLMRLRVMEAETENERRSRELKEKLMAKKRLMSESVNKAGNVDVKVA